MWWWQISRYQNSQQWVVVSTGNNVASPSYSKTYTVVCSNLPVMSCAKLSVWPPTQILHQSNYSANIVSWYQKFMATWEHQYRGCCNCLLLGNYSFWPNKYESQNKHQRSIVYLDFLKKMTFWLQLDFKLWVLTLRFLSEQNVLWDWRCVRQPLYLL